jgi:hypothetical protein
MKHLFACIAAIGVLAGAAQANPLPGAQIAVLGTIDESALSNSATVYYFNFPTILLASNTRYWIGMTSTDNGIGWYYSSDISGVGVANEYFSHGPVSYPNIYAPYLMTVLDGSTPAFDNLSAVILGRDLGTSYDSFTTPGGTFGFDSLGVVVSGVGLTGTATFALFSNDPNLVGGVPEPLTLSLFAAGVAGSFRRRRSERA